MLLVVAALAISHAAHPLDFIYYEEDPSLYLAQTSSSGVVETSDVIPTDASKPAADTSAGGVVETSDVIPTGTTKPNADSSGAQAKPQGSGDIVDTSQAVQGTPSQWAPDANAHSGDLVETSHMVHSGPEPTQTIVPHGHIIEDSYVPVYPSF